ncbi:MAG: insulinase family protein [Deltaproteobacteria bacterium]|nr:insulinase family protein [Deltaproteobacteria bacterium]
MSLDDRKLLIKAAADASSISGHRIHFDCAFSLNKSVGAARFVLDNGLKIIFAPDDRAPIFTYQTWYKVGSKHEDPNRTGLAHLFEHLMFKGTENHAAGKFDREMERRGTQTNAATWVDWTYYHQALSTYGDNFTTVVDFESDRMANLTIDKDTFTSELEVVKNERRMSIDDSVSGTLSEKLFNLAFTCHPYRWPTICSIEHLQAATIDDLKQFYRTYYAPNNAVVVVAGALDVVTTLSQLARSYGPLSAQTINQRERPCEPKQNISRRLDITHSVVVPQLCIGFHTPSQNDHDFLTAQLLADVLLDGDNARLYHRLVTISELASSVEGGLLPFAEPGLYELFIAARPEVDPEKIISVTQNELDLLANGITKDEDEKVRAAFELNFFNSLKNAVAIADTLGHFEANFADFTIGLLSLEKLKQITPVELSRVAREIFRQDNRNIVVAQSASRRNGNE